MAFTTVTFCIVDHHEYFDFDATHAVTAEWLEDGTLVEVLHGVGFPFSHEKQPKTSFLTD